MKINATYEINGRIVDKVFDKHGVQMFLSNDDEQVMFIVKTNGKSESEIIATVESKGSYGEGVCSSMEVHEGLNQDLI